MNGLRCQLRKNKKIEPTNLTQLLDFIKNYFYQIQYKINVIRMNLRSKKNSTQLPFTQLWPSCSKQPNKSNPKPTKQKLPPEQHIREHQIFSVDLYPAKQRRSSLANMSKRPEINYSNQRISMMLIPQDKQNCQVNNMSGCIYYGEQGNTNCSLINTKSINQQPQNHPKPTKNILQKQKITDQIMQVVEHNIIPFLVDKFLESEDKVNKNIERLEKIINLQNQQIYKLRERGKMLEDVVYRLEKTVVGSEGNWNNGNYNGNENGNRKRSDLETGYQYKDKFIKGIGEKGEEDGTRGIKAITENSDQSEAGIKQIEKLLEQLTISMEKSGAKSTQQINSLQKQVKKLAERQKISEQKLEQEFASRILQLITTYNDNFVDLDKRIGQLESGDKSSINRISLGKIISLAADKQKTNRHE